MIMMLSNLATKYVNGLKMIDLKLKCPQMKKNNNKLEPNDVSKHDKKEKPKKKRGLFGFLRK